MNGEKICYWINNSGNVIRKVLYFCIKDTKQEHKSFPKAGKSVFTIVSSIPKAIASLYSNISWYSGAIKACKKVASSINR